MKVHYGSERCVVAFPQLGFVLKFPSTHRVRWFKNDERPIWQRLRTIGRDIIFIAKRGWAQNRRESATWRIIRDPFLAATRFSLFGFINVQDYHKAGEDRELDGHFFNKIHAVLRTDYSVRPEDAHSWFQIANYSIKADGSLCKVDYGGENDEEVLRHFLPLLKQVRI